MTVVQAGVAETGLADACCDAIFMEAVYHHFSKPAAIDVGLFRALRPGGPRRVLGGRRMRVHADAERVFRVEGLFRLPLECETPGGQPPSVSTVW